MEKEKNNKFKIEIPDKEFKHKYTLDELEDKKDIEEKIRDLATYELINEINPPKIIYIKGNYEYKYVKEILKLNYNETNKIIFGINNSIKLKGKVINTIQEYVQKIKLCYAARGEVREEFLDKLYFFDEKIPSYMKVYKTLSGEFYLQRFISENKEYLLLSKNKLDLVEYEIKGMLTEITDFRDVGITAKVSTDLPIIFINSYTPRIIQYKNHNEFFKEIKKLNLNEDKLMNHIFSSDEKQFKGKSLRHPKYFELLISSFLFCGEYDGYPNHLLILARQGTGKTRLEECIFNKMKEMQPIVEGSGSTIKALIPSFKSSLHPDVGALITSNRLCIIDEFLRILTRVRPEEREHQLAMLNPLLEHTKRLFKSGNSQIHGIMTAKMLAVSNAIYGTKTMMDLAERIDNPFLSRLLIYYQDKEHIKWIEEKKGLKDNDFILDNDLWLSIYDYLNSFSCELDENKLKDIFNDYLMFLPEKVKDIYTSRYLHHLLCLSDGIIKTRCIIELDNTFKANNKDYDNIKEIWRKIITNWSLNANIFTIPKEERIKYLTHTEKYVFDTIQEQRKKIYEDKIYDVIKDINHENIDKYLKKLIEIELIYKHNHYYYLYYMTKEENV